MEFKWIKEVMNVSKWNVFACLCSLVLFTPFGYIKKEMNDLVTVGYREVLKEIILT